MVSMTFRHKFDRFDRPPVAVLADRQSDRDPRALAGPAADIDRAIMQLYQPLDD